MSLQQRIIEIQTVVGKKPVQAEVAGLWACHPAYHHDDGSPRFDFDWWGVTHLPTGLSITGRRALRPDLARLMVETLDASDADPPVKVSRSRDFYERTGHVMSVMATVEELYDDDLYADDPNWPVSP